MEKEEAQQQKQEKKGLIQIPSYQEVFGSATTSSAAPQPYNPPPPPSTFSQAFSSIKNSEFYTPPPPPPPHPPDQPPSHATGSQASAAPPPPSSSSTSTTTAGGSTSTSAQNRNAILVSHRQKGNPLLKHIRNARWVFADIVCDYLLSQSSCALYISLRYHLLHPDYLYYRIRELQKNFKLRVVLCHVDVEDVVKPLLEVTRTAMLHDCTLLCAWSLEECGRYLETIKVYENKSADIIREQMDTDYLSRLTHALTTVRHVNKTDVVTLGSVFGSLSHIMDASMEDLARCPGIGERKVKRLYDTFHEPFRRVSSQPPVAAPEAKKNDEEPRSANQALEVEGDKTDTSKGGKESDPSVRSALTAAFAKYADKVRKRDHKGTLVEQGECSSSTALKGSES